LPTRQQELAPMAGKMFHNSPFRQPLVDGRMPTIDRLATLRQGTGPSAEPHSLPSKFDLI
jgi:hypothetical protein